MQLTNKTILVAVATAGVALAAAGSASARGCNGYVNQLEWGCAAWDNNNGPQYPHWQAPRRQTSQPQRMQIRPNTSAYSGNRSNVSANLINRNGSGVIAAGGGNVIPAGAGN